MRKLKLLLSSLLVVLMLIGLVPATNFSREVKAEENSYKVVSKLDKRIDSMFYENKILVAYKDASNIKISLFEGGEEKKISEINSDNDIRMYPSYNYENIVAIKSTSSDEEKVDFIKFDFNNESIQSISEEEFNALTTYEVVGTDIKNEFTDEEKEAVLQKINKSEGLNLTIKDKEKVDNGDYYTYVNDTSEIIIDLDKFYHYDGQDDRIVEFSINEFDKTENKTNYYRGIVFGDYVFIRKNNNDFHREVRYAYENGNLYIWQAINDFKASKYENNIIRVNNGEFVSKNNIKDAPYNAYFEVHDEKIYIYRTTKIGDPSNGLYIYELKDNEYVLSRKLNKLGNGIMISNNEDYYAIKEDNRLKLVSLKSGNVEELLDITEAVGGYDNISPFSGLYGEKESMIFDNDNGFVIIQKNTPNESNNDDNGTTPPVEDNKPSENATFEIEIPELKAGEVNKITLNEENSTSFSITIKDMEILKSGQGSLNAVLNNVDITLPFSVIDKTLIGENDTVTLKLDILSGSEITKDLKAINKVFDFNLFVNKENEAIKIHNFKEGQAEITITLAEEEFQGLNKDKLKVYYYNEETKKFEVMETSVNGNAVTFKTSHFSKFVIAEEMESNTSVKPDTNTKEQEGKTDRETNNNTNKEAKDTNNNKDDKAEDSKAKLPNTGAVISNAIILVVALAVVSAGSVMLFKKRKRA